MGEVRKFLREAKLEEKTLVLSLLTMVHVIVWQPRRLGWPAAEGKGTAWEGGVREPTIACWPGQIPAGTESAQLAATIDILPTVAFLAGAALPERKIDGRTSGHSYREQSTNDTA